MTGYLRNLIAASSLVLGCFSFAHPAAPQSFSITITFDENGIGTFTNTNGFNSTLPHQVGLDPGPGGHSTLLYDTLNPPGLVAGDVVLLDVTSDVTFISDVIRFNTSSFTGGTGSVAFYSRDSDGGLADTGLPPAFSTNLVTITEGSGAFLLSYTPTAGQPGFVAGAGGPVTYDIAESLAVPGPIAGAGLPGLIFAGGDLLVLSRWRRKRKAVVAA